LTAQRLRGLSLDRHHPGLSRLQLEDASRSEHRPFRDVFATYKFLVYLSYRVPRLGYRCIELPTIRRNPKGEVRTKISSVNGNLSVLAILMRACTGRYDPEKTA
jgi:hypothetical protein